MPSSRNGSFASKVDKMPVKPRRKTLMQRAQDLNKPSKPKAHPIKGPKSPTSSQPAFRGNAPKPATPKAKTVKGYFTPAPGREPRPHGMGENGVNWRVHNMRMKLMRETTKGSFKHASGANAQLKSKAAKAAKKYGRETPAHIKDQYKDHSR